MAAKERLKFYLQTDQTIAETVKKTANTGSLVSVSFGASITGFGVKVGKLTAFNKVVFKVETITGTVASQTVVLAVRENNCTGTKIASKSATFESGGGLTEITIEFDTPVYSEKDLFFTVSCTTPINFYGTQGTAEAQTITTTTGSIASNVCTDSGQTGMYLFQYSLSSTIEVYPNYNNALSKQIEKETQKVFFRYKLNGNLYFQRDDYAFVRDETIEAEYILIITEDINGVFSETYRGELSKTDCDFDDDNLIFSASPAPIDRYVKILTDLEKEFNLIDLSVPTSTVQYLKLPIFQIYTLYSNVISNHIYGNKWEQEVLYQTLTPTELINDYFFKELGEQFAVSGWGDQDAAGIYTSAGGSPITYNQDAGNYKITFELVSDEYIGKLIRVSDSVVVYEPTEGFTDLFLTSVLFKPTAASGSTGAFMFQQFRTFGRALVNVDTISGYTTQPIPENDIIENNANYSHIALGTFQTPYVGFDYTETENNFLATNAAPVDPNIDATYHVPPTPLTPIDIYPAARSLWRGPSLFFSYASTIDTFIDLAKEAITNDFCYEISDIIGALVQEIDPTLSFQKTIGTSNFLHNDTTNPVTGDTGFRLFVTPKSNVIINKFDSPATKITIKLSEIFDLLKKGFNLDWYINESDGGLRIEHIKFFENGKSYSSQQIGLDLELLNEIYTGVPYSTGFNKFKYDKLSLPQFLKFAWMDDVSDSFNGSEIEVLSKYITKGQTETNLLSPFTSDIDFIQSTPNEVNKEGFALLAASIDLSDNIYKVPIVDTLIGTETVKLQNGYASLPYMHEKFHRHNLPAASVKLNENEITATTVKRSKVQELEIVVDSDFDELKLIKTDLGVGQIDAGEILFESDRTGRKAIKLTIRYDTE